VHCYNSTAKPYIKSTLATIFRTWSYQFPWLYNTISFLTTSLVGGEKRFHLLPLNDLKLTKQSAVLDLCCGGGQATKYLVQYSPSVTGLDLSPKALKRAAQLVPEANYVEGLAEEMSFPDASFNLVHSSVALHEMESVQLKQILQEVYRVLKADGQFVFVDLHRPSNLLYWPGLALFMYLFETETAWALINTDLKVLLESVGFRTVQQSFYAGGSLQVIQCQK
jgi:SAM-dependent methyltransferase